MHNTNHSEKLPRELNSLGERIQYLRKSLKLSQTEFANIIGVSKSSVSGWEINSFMPEHKRIVQMASHFNITPQELEYGVAPIIINEPPAGFINIPIYEYIEFLKFKSLHLNNA